MFLQRAVEVYMEECHSRQLRPKTMLSYEHTLKLFSFWLTGRKKISRIEDIKEKHIREYIIELQTRGKYTVRPSGYEQNFPENRKDYEKPVSSITINNYLRNMKAFFSWAQETEIISATPMRRIKALPEERKPREYLEDDEVKELLRCLDKSYFPDYRDYIAIMLMLDSGTRLGETLSIEIDEVDLIAKCVHLPASKTKGRKSRTVFFSSRTATEMRRWLEFKDRYCESEYLFPVKHSGGMLRTADFEKNFRKYLKRIGVKKHITPHTLRNNFAKRCLLAGMDIYTLSRLLGHASVEMTEKAYLDITSNDLKMKYTQFSPVEGIFENKRSRVR